MPRSGPGAIGQEEQLLPVKAANHCTSRETARDTGPSQCHGAGCFTQVVSNGSYPIHVAAAGTQAASQPANASFADTGVVPRLCD